MLGVGVSRGTGGREGGARVRANVFVRDLDLAAYTRLDNRRLEVMADGSLLWWCSVCHIHHHGVPTPLRWESHGLCPPLGSQLAYLLNKACKVFQGCESVRLPTQAQLSPAREGGRRSPKSMFRQTKSQLCGRTSGGTASQQVRCSMQWGRQ